MLAILNAHRAGLLKPKHWPANLLSGVIVGVVALPLAMAFAIASGVKPEQGIYTAIIAALLVGVFGGSRVQIAGPTGAFIVVLSAITAQYGIIGLQMATFMAGLILLFLGLLRLGNVIKFIPEPVIVGFTAGIGVIIFVGEWKDFFGLTLSSTPHPHFHQKLIALVMALPHLQLFTTVIALLSLTLVVIAPYLFKRIPGPLIAMLVATGLQAYFKFPGVATIGSTFGGIPNHLPTLQWLPFSCHDCLSLVEPAFTIALLGAIESLLSAVVADGMAGTKHDSNQELIGQGLANLVSPLFNGIAATGAIARTATNIRNGGNSPIAAIVHSVLLILVVLLLAPLAAYIPLCALAAILFVVAYNMSDVHHFVYMIKHAPKHDMLVLVTTFLLTVFTDLVIAVNVGVILSVILFTKRMSQSVSISLENTASMGINHPPNLLVYMLEGPLFFGAAEKFEHALAITHTDPATIIFRLNRVPFMDMTGLETFMEVIESLHKRKVDVCLCEANSSVAEKLMQIQLLPLLHGKKIYETFEEAINACDAGHTDTLMHEPQTI